MPARHAGWWGSDEWGWRAHAARAVQLLIHGTVPLGSGLSSSSALVVAVAVAILAAYGCSATQADVATFTCAAERYVGVNSGGMDQAISVMARPGAPPPPFPRR